MVPAKRQPGNRQPENRHPQNGRAFLVIAGLSLAVAALVWRGGTATGADPSVAHGSPPTNATDAPARLRSLAEQPSTAPEVEAPDTRGVREAVDAHRALEDSDAATVRLAGHVVLPPATPLDERVLVEVVPVPSGNAEVIVAQVTQDGRFEVSLPARARRVRLGIDANYVYLPSPVILDIEDVARGVVLEPTLGGRLVVAVVPPEHVVDPLELNVRLTPNVNSIVQPPAIRIADRTFEYRALPTELLYELVIRSGRFPDAWRDSLQLFPGRVREIEIGLARGARLAGVVLGPDGGPLEGVAVRATSRRSGLRTSGDREHTRTDAEGRFEFPAITAGEVELFLSRDDVEDRSEIVGTVEDGGELVDLRLSLAAGGRLAGRVVWADGRPASTVTVRAARVGRPWDAEVRAQSDSQGRFELGGLRGERFEVTARAQDESSGESHWWRARSGEVAPGATDLVLTLEPGDRLTGRVVDDRGEPVDRFTVRATPVDKSLLVTAGGGVRNRQRGTGGNFTLESLSPGYWDVWAEARRHTDAYPQRVELPEGAGELVFTLARTATVRGVVVDADGSPREGAQVTVSGAKRPRAKTDDRGVFELEDVPPGRTRLVAAADNRRASPEVTLDLAPAQVVDGARLVLRYGVRLEGRVDATLGHFADRRVLASPVGSYDFEAALCDEEGRFAFDGLEPGLWRVGFDWRTTGGGGEDWVSGYRDRHEVVVELKDGETAQVVLGAPSEQAVTALCRVTDGDEPQAGYIVYVFRAAERAAGALAVQPVTVGRTDAEGQCRLLLPEPGRYEFTVGEDQGDQVSFPRDVAVSGPGRSEVELHFELPDASIAGRVVGPDGEARARHPLMLVDADAPSGARNLGDINIALSADDGTFEFAGLPAGDYRLRTGGYGSTSQGMGVRVIEGLSLENGEQHDGLLVQLQRAAIVEGRVLGPDGAPVPGAVVRLLTEASRDLVIWNPVTTDPTGSFRFDEVGAGSLRIVAEGGDGTRAEKVVAVAPGEVARVVLETALH